MLKFEFKNSEQAREFARAMADYFIEVEFKGTKAVAYCNDFEDELIAEEVATEIKEQEQREAEAVADAIAIKEWFTRL